MNLLRTLQASLRGRTTDEHKTYPRGRDGGLQAETAGRTLSSGTVAPDFGLASASGEVVRLKDFRGQPVILAFYPADGTPVCANQLALYNEALPIFEEHDAQLLGISVDDPNSHRAFAADLGLRFPLLSDHAPKGQVADIYGVFNRQADQNHRALFVLDRQGIVRWSEVVPASVNPGANGILRALDDLSEAEGQGDG